MKLAPVLVPLLMALVGVVDLARAEWPPEGVRLSGTGGWARNMKLIGDGSGGVLGLWREYGPGQGLYHGRATRVTGNGDEYSNWDWANSSLWNEDFDSFTYPDGLGGVFITTYAHYAINDTTWNLLHIPPGGGLDPTWPAGGPHIQRAYPTLKIEPWVQGDGTGGALVVFRPLRRTGSPGQPSESLMVRRVLANGSFDPAWPPNGLRINAPGQPPIQTWHTVRGHADGTGGGVVVWLASRVRAQRVTASGAIAPEWPAGGLVLRDVQLGFTSFEQYPVFDVIPSGPDHFFAVWTDDTRTLWLQRFHRDGTLAAGWPTSGKYIYGFSNLPSSTNNARAIGDGSTGVYLAWMDAWTTPRGVRVLEDGSIASGWGPAGIPLLDPGAVFAPDQNGSSFDIANGSDLGLVVGWLDARAGGDARVRTRWLRADATSDPNQPDAGRIVTPLGLRVDEPALGTDSQGGVFVSWMDRTREGPYYDMLSWMPYDPSLVGVPPTPRPRAVALRAWPNPARDGLDVEFVLASGSHARLELLDVTGRRMRSLTVQGVGPHVAKLANLDLVPRGVYLLRLEQGNTIQTTRIALVD